MYCVTVIKKRVDDLTKIAVIFAPDCIPHRKVMVVTCA